MISGIETSGSCRCRCNLPTNVTPAKAGVHPSTTSWVAAWTPAFAGVTTRVHSPPPSRQTLPENAAAAHEEDEKIDGERVDADQDRGDGGDRRIDLHDELVE